jgi:choloylglycine hydrolase
VPAHEATDFGPRDPALQGVQAGLWGRYLLDNAATVTEALALMSRLQPVMVEIHGHKANLHLAIEDAGGDSAIVEFIDGKPRVHHGLQHTVMTNDPPFDQQRANLARYDFRAAVANVMAIARNVSAPFGAPNNPPGTLYNTGYRTVVDATNRRNLFKMADQPNVVWLRLDAFDLRNGAPVRKLDPTDVALSGDVSARFRPAKLPF